MQRRTHLAGLLAAVCILGPGRFAAAAEPPKTDDPATALATRITEEGAATFDNFDARAMAAYYLDDAELSLVTESDGGLKVEKYQGRAEIEKAYTKVFEKPETIKSKNSVEYARLLNPEVLVIAGTFDTNTLKADSAKVPFYQVRMKKGEKWLISSMKIFVLPQKS